MVLVMSFISLTMFFFFYGSILTQGVGRVLGNPYNFFPAIFVFWGHRMARVLLTSGRHLETSILIQALRAQARLTSP